MRALLVANPAATTTTGRTREVLTRALSSELKVDVVTTDHRGHAAELGRQAMDDGIDVVVALGGDGTVNEVVNGLLAAGPGRHVPMLAVVPGGSANVFARTLGLSADPVEATGEILDAVRGGRSRTVSLGRADERWFTFTAGMGFDAEVVARVERLRARGRRAGPALYVRTAIRRFYTSRLRYQPCMTLRIPGEPARDGLFLCLVTNTTPWTYVGNRAIQTTPEASYDKGLDVFALRRAGTLRTLGHLRQVTRRAPRPRGRRLVTRHDLDELAVTAPRPLPVQVDGDYVGVRQSVHFSVVAEALRVVG